MTDTPISPSGSRWEPEADAAVASLGPEGQTDPAPVAPSVAPPADIRADIPVDAPEAPPAGEGRGPLRRRAVLAGAAAALVLGGYVIGHSTVGHDGFSPANFRQGRLDNGQQRPPGLGVPDGDGDHGFGQQPPPQGSTGGSGTSGGTSANPT